LELWFAFVRKKPSVPIIGRRIVVIHATIARNGIYTQNAPKRLARTEVAEQPIDILIGDLRGWKSEEGIARSASTARFKESHSILHQQPRQSLPLRIGPCAMRISPTIVC
jgi:hypothetical protein